MIYAIQDYVQEIRKARLEKGMSQKELAKKAGITQSHLSRVERGEIDLRLSTLTQLVRLVGLEIVFVKKSSLSAVQALTKNLEQGNINKDKPAYSLDDEL